MRDPAPGGRFPGDQHRPTGSIGTHHRPDQACHPVDFGRNDLRRDVVRHVTDSGQHYQFCLRQRLGESLRVDDR
jgi:hypothetical protein